MPWILLRRSRVRLPCVLVFFNVFFEVFFQVFCKLKLRLVLVLRLVLRLELRLRLSLVLDFGLRCVQIFTVRSVNSGLRSVNFYGT